MAIPVRLIHHENYGPHPEDWWQKQIYLTATEFRVAIERNVSAFALPFNNAFKVGIDPNMPRTLVNITGILEDDDAASGDNNFPVVKINTGQYYPDANWGLDEVSRVMEVIMNKMQDAHGNKMRITASTDYTTSATSIVVNGPLKCTTNALQLTSNNNKTSLAHFFFNGDKVYNLSGQELGTVSSVDNSTNTITFTGAISYPLAANEHIVDTTPDLLLHDKGFGLVPALWCTKDANLFDFHVGRAFPLNIPIVYRFDGNTVSKYANGGSGDVSFVSNTEPEKQTRQGHHFPTISIPIGGIFNNTNTSSYGDASKALLLAIKDGIDLTSNITAKKTTIGGGRTSAAAFSTSLSSSGRVLIVTQNECTFDTIGVQSIPTSNPNNTSIYAGLNWLKGVAPSGVRSGWERGEAFGITSFSDNHGASGPLSAGDKAQTLLGMFANCPVGSDNEFVGIQVPYESLIQSSDLTPTVRNFFLTYGNLTSDDKTSRYNSRPASEVMWTQSRALTELPETDNADETDFWSIIDSFGQSLINIASDVMVVLGSTERKNRGGIHIIPTKFALRYDAGQRHYTYDMVLSAIGEKISV